MFLLMMVLSLWAEDPAYVVNEEHCKFGHFVELPKDKRQGRLIKACIYRMEGKTPPLFERVLANPVRPLTELMKAPAELR
ncbi:hypothetical protein L2088_20170 [Pseudomonas protegens]|uniref:hypothetical protein n=1 Tax=Pseudomonas protegens TaxID=380021 RepID=UPI002024C0C4|nr:hypothetical protein [Pseudomonas protegens]MCL9657028.1 hypothetical protein [Pseudomonas protegens]